MSNYPNNTDQSHLTDNRNTYRVTVESEFEIEALNFEEACEGVHEYLRDNVNDIKYSIKRV